MRVWFPSLAILLLASRAAAPGAQQPASDDGAAGAWQKLLKVRTTASLMHTTAHPDDEHGGVLAMLSRGHGARVSLMTLTRGESGDNVIGPELFDALALVRTEELTVAGRFYGLDRQYFGTVVDYGYSKRLEEALEKWGREHVLRDLVAVIRTERPFVIVSRFQGNARDGHGNHVAAGLLSREAFSMAGDPAAYPDQIAAGLRPWRPLKLYMGGVRENEDWTIRVDAGTYDPVLGDSYQGLARQGLGYQRSQNGGRAARSAGPAPFYYKRLESVVDAPGRETSFFDGIDTTIPGLYRALGRTAPPGAEGLLSAIDREVAEAIDRFSITDPSASADALAKALASTRAAARTLGADADVAGLLGGKAEQIQEALHAVLGVRLDAVALPRGTAPAGGASAAGAPPMPPVVPGQTFEVRTTLAIRGRAVPDAPPVVTLDAPAGWKFSAEAGGAPGTGAPGGARFAVTVPHDAPPSRPHFRRASIRDARYAIDHAPAAHSPRPEALLHARATYAFRGVPLEIRRPVMRFQSDLPYGYSAHAVTVVPALSVLLAPSHAIVPLDGGRHNLAVSVEVLHNRGEPSSGVLMLELPAGWSAAPASHPLRFSHAGERALYTFEVAVPSARGGEGRIAAVGSLDGREYREGFTIIRHRDLETRHFYRDAVAAVRGVDVRIAPGRRVGYVMGAGDDVPAGLRQLGVDVQLLGESDLATGDLRQFHAIMTGTRAYAVREDLRTYNRRLLDYVNAGGNLIVLYNTQELVPARHAPYPGELPASAEEVSEEDSPVEILAPALPVLTTPNRITPADFEGWVEQRGSKFWATWDPRYTPVLATWDRGQAPQRGGWLYARYGKGHYTYFAYAFHRQLPYAVPGAYRLLANLLSLEPQSSAVPE